MCRVLNIERSGFYAWLKQPLSAKEKDDNRLLGKIKQFWLESGFTYGYRNITIDLKSDGETCGKNRVYRLMRQANIRAVRGYKRHPGLAMARDVLSSMLKLPFRYINTDTKSNLFISAAPPECEVDYSSIRDYESGNWRKTPKINQ